jgi:hypothetical protein
MPLQERKEDHISLSNGLQAPKCPTIYFLAESHLSQKLATTWLEPSALRGEKGLAEYMRLERGSLTTQPDLDSIMLLLSGTVPKLDIGLTSSPLPEIQSFFQIWKFES